MHLYVNLVNVTSYNIIPLSLQNAYLPTMPEDILPEARRVLGGAFYGNNYVHAVMNLCL